jgi:hypothetical protein
MMLVPSPQSRNGGDAVGLICLRQGWGLVLAAALLVGCAFDNVGLLASRVTSAEGAWVVDVYSAGAYLHTRADDPGLQVGAGRRSYVFDKRDEDELTPGWHYFTAPLPDRPSYARDSRSYGLDTTFARNDLSVTLGLRATTVMAQIDANKSHFFHLTYLPGQPALTKLEVFEREGDLACRSCQWPSDSPSQQEWR